MTTGKRISAPVSSIEARRSERRRSRRRLWAIRGGIAAAVVALAGLMVWLVAFSPVLAFNGDTEVDGAQSAEDPAQVDALLADVLAPQVGTPLARVPTGALAREIEENPQVARAQVSRSWPSSLRVTVEPQVARMVAYLEEGESVMVGADGSLLGSMPEGREDLPVVALSALNTQSPSPDPAALQREAQVALQIWEAAPAGLRDQLQLIDVTESGASLMLVGGARVIWGAADQSELKAQVLGPLLAAVPASVYDVSNPAHPSTR